MRSGLNGVNQDVVSFANFYGGCSRDRWQSLRSAHGRVVLRAGFARRLKCVSPKALAASRQRGGFRGSSDADVLYDECNSWGSPLNGLPLLTQSPGISNRQLMPSLANASSTVPPSSKGMSSRIMAVP